MPAADTARLIAALEMDASKFIAGANKANASLNRLSGKFDAIGSHAKRGLSTAAGNIAKIGAVATAALTSQIAAGVDSLASLEDATTSVTGALQTMGLQRRITASTIADWANQIEASTQAAFDDKDITAATATLIRYGKVGLPQLRQAMVVMTDLAARTGSVDSASRLLAKALADPAKAAGALRKAGVVLTKSQEDQLKSFGKLDKNEQKHYDALRKVNKVEAERYKKVQLSNHQLYAQQFVLDQLARTTKGAASNAFGPWRDMQHVLGDTVEDAQRLLAKGAMPVLQTLGTRIQEALANPETMKDIENLGKAAGDVLSKAIDFAGKVPWGSIKDALVLGGTGAKAILDAFTSMPAWVQTAVISGWGLNKLTGGALTNILGDLGSGLGKWIGQKIGLMTVQASVVNVNGGVAGGGVPGAPGGGGGGAGIAPALAPMGLGALFATGLAGFGFGELATGISHAVSDGLSEVLGLGQAGKDAGQRARDQTFLGLFDKVNDLPGTINKMADAVGQLGTFINSPHPDFLGDLGKLLVTDYHPKISNAPDKGMPRGEHAAVNDPLKPVVRDVSRDVRNSAKVTQQKQDAAKLAQVQAIRDTGSTTGQNIRGTTGAVQSAQSAITAAIAAAKPVITFTVNLTASGVQKVSTTSSRYGNSNGSAGGGTGGGGQSKYN